MDLRRCMLKTDWILANCFRVGWASVYRPGWLRSFIFLVIRIVAAPSLQLLTHIHLHIFVWSLCCRKKNILINSELFFSLFLGGAGLATPALRVLWHIFRLNMDSNFNPNFKWGFKICEPRDEVKQNRFLEWWTYPKKKAGVWMTFLSQNIQTSQEQTWLCFWWGERKLGILQSIRLSSYSKKQKMKILPHNKNTSSNVWKQTPCLWSINVYELKDKTFE